MKTKIAQSMTHKVSILLLNISMDILRSNIDTLWVIDCAILVFIMQAGFMCMETGLSRHKNSINVALKNAADFGVSVVIFWIFGFGLMFGTSYNGFFGTDLFFFKTDKAEYMYSALSVLKKNRSVPKKPL